MCLYEKNNFSKEGFDKLDHHNPLKRLGPQAISHLKSEHIDYIMQWTAFLQLESNVENSKDNLVSKTSDIWTLTIDERLVCVPNYYVCLFRYVFGFLNCLHNFSEKRGQCIAFLKITNAVKEEGNRYYLHRMEKSDKCCQKDFSLTNFSISNYSVVSTDKRNAIATGFVSAINKKTIDILLDR